MATVKQTKTINGSTGSSVWTWKMVITESWNDDYLTTNKSIVNVKSYMGRGSSGSYFGGTATQKITVGDKKSEASKTYSYPTNVGAYGWVLMYEATFEIEHDSDGSKKITVTSSMSGATFSPTTASASGEIQLTTIPRASKITATSANIGETSQISVTQYSNSFRHTIAFSFGSLNGYILEDGSISQTLTKISATSIGFQIPRNWYNEIPNDQEGLCTLTITTYNGDDAIGTNTCTFYARVGGNVSVSGSVVDTNATTLALTGNNNILVKGYSNARVSWSASPTTGASLSSVRINGTGVSSSPYSFILNDTQISIVATDSRGKTNASNPYHPSFTLKNYSRPNLSTNLERISPTSGYAKLSFSGTWFNDSFGSVANTLAIVWKYRESGSSTWITGGTLVPNADYKVSGNNFWSGMGSSVGEIQIGGSFSYEKSWDIALIITDKLSSSTIIGTITKGVPIANWEEEFFNINGKLNLFGITIIKHIANVLWPVNSIYTSLTQELPSFLSGEWTLLDTLVNGSKTYYIYKRTSEDELLCYEGDSILYNSEEIYIDNNLLKGDDVL